MGLFKRWLVLYQRVFCCCLWYLFRLFAVRFDIRFFHFLIDRWQIITSDNELFHKYLNVKLMIIGFRIYCNSLRILWQRVDCWNSQFSLSKTQIFYSKTRVCIVNRSVVPGKCYPKPSQSNIPNKYTTVQGTSQYFKSFPIFWRNQRFENQWQNSKDCTKTVK